MGAHRPEKRLDILHAAWASAGRAPQTGVDWSRAAWCRALPGHAEFFAGLPDRINRTVVSDHFRPVRARAGITDAFVVAMLWGHGSTGYGGWRTQQILGQASDAASRLLDVYETARQSPLEAYRSMGYRHRNRLVGLGPAFGTKYIAYAAASNGTEAPILDALTAAWVAMYAGESFAPAVWRPTEYARYVDLLAAWSVHIGESIEVTEFLIFADASKHLSRNRRRTSQWAEAWVPDIDGA